MSTAPLPRADITVIHVSLVTRQATKGVVSTRRRKHQSYDQFRRVLPAILRGPHPRRFGCQEPLSDDARYLGTVKVEYLFHPLFGQAVRDVRCDAKGRTEGQLLVDTSQGRQCVPAWMTDPKRCAALTFGLQPFASEQALRLLDALLASLDGRDLSPKLDS